MNDPMVFSAEWFERHQGKLLWLLNHWLTRRWFRWVLRIRGCDIGHVLPIIELFPHAYTVLLRELDDGRIEVATDFRTHHKFAKRLYYAFRPLWWLIHLWDLAIADNWFPRLSFGFNTLTAFGVPLVTAGTMWDAPAKRNGVDETFAVIQAGAGTSAGGTNATEALSLVASVTTDQFATLTRLFFTFDTSSISNASEITTATFSVFGTSQASALGQTAMTVAKSTHNYLSSPTGAVYQSKGDTEIGARIEYGSFSTVGYNDFAFTDLTAVIKKGITLLCLRLGWDMDVAFGGVWASAATTSLTVNMADASGTANDPKLVLVYLDAQRFAVQFNFLVNNLRPRLFRPGNAR